MKETYEILTSIAGIDPLLGLCYLTITREKEYETKILRLLNRGVDLLNY